MQGGPGPVLTPALPADGPAGGPFPLSLPILNWVAAGAGALRTAAGTQPRVSRLWMRLLRPEPLPLSSLIYVSQWGHLALKSELFLSLSTERQ